MTKRKTNPKAGRQTSGEIANRASHVMREGKKLLKLDVWSHEVRQLIENAVRVAGSALGQKESQGK